MPHARVQQRFDCSMPPSRPQVFHPPLAEHWPSTKSSHNKNLRNIALNLGGESVQTYEDIANSLDSFDTTSHEWSLIAQAISPYFRTLVSSKKWEGAAILLTRLNRHTQRFSEAFVMIYKGIANSEDLLLHLGYHNRDHRVLTDFMNNALASAPRYEDESAVVTLVKIYAYLLLRPAKPQMSDAISMLEAVADHSHSSGYLKDVAEREIARHFFTGMLRARNEDRWQQVAENAEKLIKLVVADEQDAEIAFLQIRDCFLILAALYQVNGLHTRARQSVRSDVKVGIDYLSDTDPENDSMAWYTLCDSLLAAGDETRAVAAVNMIRSGRFIDIEQLEEPSAVVDIAVPVADDTYAGTSDQQPESEGEIARPPPPEAQANVSRTLSAVSTPSDCTQHPPSIKADGDNQASDRITSQQSSDEPLPSGGSPSSQESDKAQPAIDPGYPFFRCDGCCFQFIANDTPMWRCRYCIADFCVDCHDLINGGNMVGWNICDSLHHHVCSRNFSQVPKGLHQNE